MKNQKVNKYIPGRGRGYIYSPFTVFQNLNTAAPNGGRS